VIDKSERQPEKHNSGSEMTKGGTVNKQSEVQPEKHSFSIVWIPS
jgi:hypothetical protein